MHRAAGRRIAIEGAAVAATGLMLFVAVHSVLIAPIWTRAAKGVPLALLAGCGLAGAFSRIGRLTGRPHADGALFGAAMFLSLVPETLVSNALRLSGVAANGWPGVLGSIAIAIVSGAATGWWVTRDRRAIPWFAFATLALTIGTAGPIPIVNGAAAAWLFAAFLPMLICGGVVLAVVHRAAMQEER